LGLRVVCVERNGFGQTPFDPGLGVADYVDDVLDVLATIAIERFAIVAMSGGATYAIALAARVPERIISVHLAAASSGPLPGGPTVHPHRVNVRRVAPGVCEHYPDLIAYGAGWTDAERQQPVGDTGRREPRHLDAIVDAELRRALEDPDPLHGIAQLVARWGAAFVLDPDGVTRTKVLGSERMAGKLRDAMPGGEQPLRAALWAFIRPILSPRLVELNQDAFVFDAGVESSVDLDAHRADSDLGELDLGEDEHAAAA
jgi:pimeloyl-ACP methyl ester carboxylesterase